MSEKSSQIDTNGYLQINDAKRHLHADALAFVLLDAGERAPSRPSAGQRRLGNWRPRGPWDEFEGTVEGQPKTAEFGQL